MPRQKNGKVHSHWDVLKWDTDPAKVCVLLNKLTLKLQYACKHCGKNYTGNVTRLKEHLAKCKTFQKAIAKEKKDTGNAVQQGSFTLATPSQTPINFPRISKSEKANLDIQAAMWCFMGNHPFTMFESTFAMTFLHGLNSAYKPPSRKMISGPLLDAVYSQVKTRTDNVITTLQHINVIMDESTNINSTRISNISIQLDAGSLHYISEDIWTIQMTAFASAQWLRSHLINLVSNEPTRLNSITNDTCSTMFSMWGEIEKFPEFKHVFFVPCDSHGLQLFVKDLLRHQDSKISVRA